MTSSSPSSTPLVDTVKLWDALIVDEEGFYEAMDMMDDQCYGSTNMRDLGIDRCFGYSGRTDWWKWQTNLLVETLHEFGNWSSWQEDVEKNQVTCVGLRTLDNGNLELPVERTVTLYEGKIQAFDIKCISKTSQHKKYENFILKKNVQTLQKWDSLLREGNMHEAQKYMTGAPPEYTGRRYTVESYLKDLKAAISGMNKHGWFDTSDPIPGMQSPWSDFTKSNCPIYGVPEVCSQAFLKIRGFKLRVSRKVSLMFGKIYDAKISADWDSEDGKVSYSTAIAAEAANGWDRFIAEAAVDEHAVSTVREKLADYFMMDSNMPDLALGWQWLFKEKTRKLVFRLKEFRWYGHRLGERSVIISDGTRRLDTGKHIRVTREMLISDGKCKWQRIHCPDSNDLAAYTEHFETRCINTVQKLDAALVGGTDMNKEHILSYLSTDEQGQFSFHSNFFDLQDSSKEKSWLETTAPTIASSCEWTNYKFSVERGRHTVTSDGHRVLEFVGVPVQRTIVFSQGGIVSISIQGPADHPVVNQAAGKQSLELVSTLDSMLTNGQQMRVAGLFCRIISISSSNMDLKSLHLSTEYRCFKSEWKEWIELHGQKLAREFDWNSHGANAKGDTVVSEGFYNTPFLTIPVKREVVIHESKIQKMHLECSRKDHLLLLCARIQSNDPSLQEINLRFRNNEEVTLVGEAMKAATQVKEVLVLIRDKAVDTSYLSEFVTNCATSGVTLSLGKAFHEIDPNRKRDNGEGDMQGYLDDVLGSVACQPQVVKLATSERVPCSKNVLAGLLSTTLSLKTLVFRYIQQGSCLSLFEAMKQNTSVTLLTIEPGEGGYFYKMSDEELAAAENMLRENKHLRFLDLHPLISIYGEATAKSIARGLQVNRGLQELRLETNYVSLFADALRDNSSLCSLHILRCEEPRSHYEEHQGIEIQMTILKSLEQNFALTQLKVEHCGEKFSSKLNRVCSRNKLIKWIKSEQCSLSTNAAFSPTILHRMYVKAKDGASLIFLALKEQLVSKLVSAHLQNLSGEKRSAGAAFQD